MLDRERRRILDHWSATEPRFNSTARAILTEILGRGQKFYESQRALGRRMGIHRVTINHYFRLLREIGAIEDVAGGRGYPCHVRVIVPDAVSKSAESAQGCSDTTTGGCSDTTTGGVAVPLHHKRQVRHHWKSGARPAPVTELRTERVNDLINDGLSPEAAANAVETVLANKPETMTDREALYAGTFFRLRREALRPAAGSSLVISDDERLKP